MTGKLRIDTQGQLFSKHWKLYLDDVDISGYVRNVHIEAGVDNPVPKILLEFVRLEINVPKEVQGMIETYRQKTEPVNV